MVISRFLGRDVITKPACPFCGMPIEKPKELNTRMPLEMPVGNCTCGAVYAFDATGHNLGTAMIDALVFACAGDWDLAWDLLPEEDYLENQVQNYDGETHLVVPGGAHEGRRISGVLYFIRLQEDIREVTENGVKNRLRHATEISRASSSPRKGRKTFSKKDVEALVNGYDLQAILDLAAHDKRIIRDLKRLLYAVDKLLRWKAADILGKVSAIIARENPETISRLLQGLLTSLTDTAASSWGSLVAVGEIISNRPQQFAGYTPYLYRLTKDRELLPEVLMALGRIAERGTHLGGKVANRCIPFLNDPDPEIRGYAAVLLGNLAVHEARSHLEKLIDDVAELEIYRNGRLETHTVAQLTSEALSKL